jgi:outer membrane protein assembly factor BamB
MNKKFLTESGGAINMKSVIMTVAVIAVLAAGMTGMAGDWPQWRGANRDGICTEKGLAKSWPKDGPKLEWAKEGVGKGYSTVAVADKKLYLTGEIDKQGILFCLSLTGDTLWQSPYGPEFVTSYPGARSTPTVDGGNVYVMSGQGQVSCFAAKDGREIWKIDTQQKFGASIVQWGIAESILIDGDNLICTPGGKDATVVALNKKNGETVWISKGSGEKSAYCSAIAVNHGTTRMIITMVEKSIIGIDAKTGNLLWRHPHETKYNVNPVTPIYRDGLVFASSNYGTGSVLLKIAGDGKSVTQIWKGPKPDVHHGGIVLFGDIVVGAIAQGWVGVELSTGNLKWENPGVKKGSLIALGSDRVIGYGENGEVALMDVAASGLTTKGNFKVTQGSGEHWAHPVISDGVLYLRHGTTLMAYDIRDK